jgi:hypothetical protein
MSFSKPNPASSVTDLFIKKEKEVVRLAFYPMVGEWVVAELLLRGSGSQYDQRLLTAMWHRAIEVQFLLPMQVFSFQQLAVGSILMVM